MKALTGIQLINWHYFINERIRLQGSALLTGDNGSGKSTIFDAIQYALIADQRKVRFNVSAHDETNRDLKGYLRCRTGQDDPQGGDGEGFLRSGDFTSYVALEFQDTARQEQFLLGFAVDTFAGEPDTPQFFRAGGKLDDRLFLTGDRPYSVTEFKAVLKGRRGSEVFSTAAAYRTALKAQLGHLDDRFFTLLVKALAFHPITDIRKFVYDYVLDEREVKIDAMLENFRQYRQYDTLVHQTKEKLARLEGILRIHQERVTLEATAAIQQYVITLAEREAVQADLDRLKSEQQRLRSDYAAADADLARLQAEEQQLEEQLRELQDARARNDAYLAIQALDRELADLNQRADRLQRDGLQLADEARHAVRALQSARRFQSEHPETLRLTEEHLTLLTDGAERLAPLAGGDFSTEPADLSALAPGLEVLSDHVVGRETELRSEQRALEVEKKELDETLSALRKRQRRYDRPVEALLTAIMEKLPDVAPRPLCELIEFPHEAGPKAGGGYLNTQRVDL
ncbi:MAG: ATP-binding protein, partial [Mycobacterium leprae]